MIVCKTDHDQSLADAIWPSFVPTLEEKHGAAGGIGRRGEESAAAIIQKYFDGVKVLISHEDCLHQLMGIDITLINKDGTISLVDVKAGRSGLYYSDGSWYITLRKDHYNTMKKTEYLMHIGPKGDVYAYYDREQMAGFIRKKGIKLDTPFLLKRRHFPDFVMTNVR